MQKSSLSLLSINPGSRYFGIAVFIDSDLREWAVMSIGGNRIQEKVQKIKSILAYLIAQFNLNTVVLKKLHSSRTSRNLDCLVAEIKKAVREHGLGVDEYTYEEVKASFGGREKMNKRRLMEEMAKKYTFLSLELEREENHRSPYLIRMFEAIALGSMCSGRWEQGYRKVDSHSRS